MHHYIVVGTGPAGIVAAKTLLEKGHRVTVLDVGEGLEANIEEKVDHLSQLNSSDWKDEAVDFMKEGVSVSASGVEQKVTYGSGYPYRHMESIQPLKQDDVKVVRSFAKGGLSTVWGSAVLPMAEEDMEDWPFGFDELKPHYQSLLDWMPVTSIVDGVDDCFSIELKGSGKPMMSSQAHKLQEYWGATSNELARRGYAYGASKLAFDAGGCERCGLCLYGCPKHLIYDSSSTLDELMRNECFTYRKSWIVSKVDEESNDVRVWAKNKDSGERRSFVGDRVFLAAGAVSTTRIVMSSLGMFRTKVKMLHSDHFQFPLISHCPTSNVREENLHTLAQMFLLRKDEDQKWLNMQLYTYNDFYSKLLDKKLRNFPMMITSKLKGYLENRLLVIKGYLHSDTSSHMIFSLASEDAPLQVEGARNKEATVMARSTMLSLFKDRRHLGMTPLLPMFKMGIPGQGNHSGGSFPMMSTPVEGGSNRLGVPVGLRRTHIVDATAFSSIPSTTITFTAMANARRIVHEVLA